jgi:hypothetical protein
MQEQFNWVTEGRDILKKLEHFAKESGLDAHSAATSRISIPSVRCTAQ